MLHWPFTLEKIKPPPNPGYLDHEMKIPLIWWVFSGAGRGREEGIDKMIHFKLEWLCPGFAQSQANGSTI